jgi:hypothetical protein
VLIIQQDTACPVKFMLMMSVADLTWVAPEDGTGVKFFEKDSVAYLTGAVNNRPCPSVCVCG